MPAVCKAKTRAKGESAFGISRASTIAGFAMSLMAAAVQAEVAPPEQGVEEVLVTGTFIRGADPVGVQVIGISAEDVAASGAVNSNDLLATAPQVTNLFNERTSIPPGASQQIQIVRPNLRNLPGGTLATGAATLILLDGHRLPALGVDQAAPDADMIPPGVLARVELATDGGSATYGSDAIGGVINFISRKRVDGVELDMSYGFADDYETYDLGILAGTEWDDGSVFGAYSYGYKDDLLGGDRDWARRINWSTDGLGSERRCSPANVVVGGVNYAMPSLQPNTVNACDFLQDEVLSPEQERHNFFVGYSQDIGDDVVVGVTAFYSERATVSPHGAQQGLSNLSATNPYYMDIDGSGGVQNVSFDFGGYRGSPDEESDFAAWNIAPTLAWEIGSGWALNALLNYGEGETDYDKPDVNATLLNQYSGGTTLQDAINPYSIADTVNTALLDEILDWKLLGDSESEMLQARVILDGPVYELNSGEVLLALGLEYLDETFEQTKGSASSTNRDGLVTGDASRDVSSAFAELQIPIVGENNSLPLVHSLDISLAVRYDDYSDFGDTLNPKYAIDYSPVEWMTFRANYGESFNAPSLVDLVAGSQTVTSVFPFVPIVPPSEVATVPPGSWAVALQGANLNLKPQKADTWSAGFDMEPPVLPGLKLSATYYEIEFTDALGRPPVFDPSLFFGNSGYAQFYVLNPSADDIRAFVAQTINPEEADVLLQPGAPNVFEIIDFRTANLGNTNIEGLDIAATYITDLDFGTLELGFSGNFRLGSETQLGPGLDYENDLEFGQPEYYLQGRVGVVVDNLTARATWKYRDGYDVIRAANQPQDEINAFDTIDLYFGYEVDGSGWREDLTVTLNVNNVFDDDPPENRLDNGDGYANGFTVGRMFQLGLRKKF